MRPALHRCPDNLLARRRRGPLSAVERRALDAHIGVCDLCRAELAFGSLFDDVSDLPGAEDDALLSRLADRVAYGALSAGIRGGARALAVVAAIALLAVAGGAAAWVSRRRASPPPFNNGAIVMPAPTTPRGVPTVVVTLADLQTPELSPPKLSRPDLSPPEPSRPERSPPALSPREFSRPALLPVRTPSSQRQLHPADRGPLPSVDPSGCAQTAADLFAAANATRRSGNLPEAVRQYQALQDRCPGSAEAAVSRVSSGDLFARLGNPVAALDQLEHYLTEHPSGPLVPEALFGRARCFESLRRRDDELGTWQDLLRRFPGSIYQSTGRRRVEELTR